MGRVPAQDAAPTSGPESRGQDRLDLVCTYTVTLHLALYTLQTSVEFWSIFLVNYVNGLS